MKTKHGEYNAITSSKSIVDPFTIYIYIYSINGRLQKTHKSNILRIIDTKIQWWYFYGIDMDELFTNSFLRMEKLSNAFFGENEKKKKKK